MSDEEAEFWEHFEEQVKDDLLPKLLDSAFMMTITPTGEPDIKIAVEMGLGVLLDKPIIAIKQPGQQIPKNLERLAVSIIELDLDDPNSGERMRGQIARLLKELKINEKERNPSSDPGAGGDASG